MQKHTIPSVAYIRVATVEQNTAIAQQKRQLTEFAKGRFNIVAWYIDVGKPVSKDRDKKTDFSRLLADAPKAEWQVVLCMDISRLGRSDALESAFAKLTLRNAGKKLHTVADGEIDWKTTTPQIGF